MSLLIKITKDPAVLNYWKYLQVEDLGANLQRTVSLIKIPGDTNISLDLGLSEWSLSITGVVANSMTLQASGSVANFADLADMRSWGTSYLVRLHFGTNSYADGKIEGINIRRESGYDFWTYTMSFAVDAMTVA